VLETQGDNAIGFKVNPIRLANGFSFPTYEYIKLNKPKIIFWLIQKNKSKKNAGLIIISIQEI